jgi:hypothetical protein
LILTVAKILMMPRRYRREIDSLAVLRQWREQCRERWLYGSPSTLSAAPAGHGGKSDLPRGAKSRTQTSLNFRGK